MYWMIHSARVPVQAISMTTAEFVQTVMQRAPLVMEEQVIIVYHVHLEDI